MKANPIYSQSCCRRMVPACIISAFAAVAALLSFGANGRCADYPSSVPDSSTNALPGRIGLGYGGALPEFDLQIPDTKAEAAEEHGIMLGLNWARQLHYGEVYNELDALGIYVQMGLTPVSALAGAAYGSFAGESSRKLKPAVTALTNAMAELQVHQALRHQLLLLIREKSPQPVRVVTNVFPAETAFRVPTLMDAYAPLPFSFAARQQDKECGPAAFDGMDTLVLIRVVNHGLSGLDGPNSALSLNMAVRVTLVRVADRAQLMSFYTQYDSPPRKFVDWAISDAQPFRVEFERALQNLAEQIVVQSGLQLPQSPQAPSGIAQASSMAVSINVGH